ncbi:hypothetical protein V1503_18985 [Bacillus sp. SCS-151]
MLTILIVIQTVCVTSSTIHTVKRLKPKQIKLKNKSNKYYKVGDIK